MVFMCRFTSYIVLKCTAQYFFFPTCVSSCVCCASRQLLLLSDDHFCNAALLGHFTHQVRTSLIYCPCKRVILLMGLCNLLTIIPFMHQGLGSVFWWRIKGYFIWFRKIFPLVTHVTVRELTEQLSAWTYTVYLQHFHTPPTIFAHFLIAMQYNFI